MPSVAPKKRDLYLGKCLDDLHRLTEIQPLGNNVNVIVRSSKKVFQDAELHDSKGDEERSYVLYLKYFNIVKQIKQKAEYKKQKEYFDNIIGRTNQEKAITRAEGLSESLKERYDFKEAEALAKKLATANPGSTAQAKKKDVDVEPIPDSSENVPIATKVDKPAPVENSIDCTNLCSLLRDTASKVIIMDVRGVEDFSQSHISHSGCINIPENTIKPGSTVSHIQSKLPQDSLETWQQRKFADFIVLLDWRSSIDQVIIGSPLRTLKDALFKFDMGTVIKSEPLVLEKGYENWLLFYPTMTTNAHVQMPNAKTDVQLPSPTITLDFEYPELDDNLEKIVPAAPVTTTPKNENEMSSIVSNPGVMDKSIPRVDRSLKPSVANFQRGDEKTLNNGAPPNNILNNNIYPSFESIAAKPVANTMGIKNTNLPSNVRDKLDLEYKGFTLSVKNDFAKDLNKNTANLKKTEPESKDFQMPRNHQLNENKLRLEETEKKLHDLELMKKKEEKNVADLLRMKKKLTEDINAEKKMKEEYQDRQAIEDQKKILEIERAKAEADKNQRLAEVERMRLERKKAELEKEIEKRLQEDEEEERQWQATQDALRLQKEEEQRQHVLAVQQEQEREAKKGQIENVLPEKELLVKDEEAERARQQEEAARQAIEADKKANEAREMALLKKQQQEAAKAEAERQRQEQLALELEQKKQLYLEQKKAEEKAAAERAAQEKQLEEKKQQQTTNQNAAWKTIPSNMLPPGWEKRLDQTTNRYFYIDHKRGVTQWTSPAMPNAASGKAGAYTTTLKEEPSVSSSRGLSRSHSSPNIKKQLEEEEEKMKRVMPLPSVNRGSKPMPRAQNLMAKQTAHSSRKRDLNPIYGNVGPALTGLRNLGNTCYMNSTIQCLNNTSPLITYILNDAYVSDVNRESSQGMYGEVVDDFAVVVKALWSQQYRSITPRDLKAVVAKYNPMFAGYQQQDSQEFLTFLLDGLHEGLNEVRRPPEIPEQNNDGIPDREAAGLAWKHHKMLHRSIIVELFQGQLKSTLQCGTCSKTSVTFQAFMFLSLPIPTSSRCSLQDCIRAFLKPEMMTGSSRWKCPRCKVERDSEKKIEIWKLPPILLVGLNRFYSEGMWMQKKSSYVDFPLNGLDLTQYITGSRPRNPYNLYGISNHYGTMEGGHYTAFCRNSVSKKWYKFDDQDVYEISTSDVKTSAAFVLYYTSIEMPAPRYVPRL